MEEQIRNESHKKGIMQDPEEAGVGEEQSNGETGNARAKADGADAALHTCLTKERARATLSPPPVLSTLLLH